MKYSGITENGVLIQTDNVEDLRGQYFKSITITENMTKEQVIKVFGIDNKLSEDFTK